VSGLFLILSIIGLASCGSDSGGPAVAHVGDTTIGRSDVEHWARVVQQGGAQGLHLEGHGTPIQRALSLLISAQWIKAEAERQGVAPSSKRVDEALTERKEANGASEFEAALHAAGQSLDDVKLEVETELAAAAIGRKLARQAGRFSEAEVMSFYAHNPRLFTTPEERYAELIEHLPSPAAAVALVRRIGTGSQFKKRALKEAVVRAANGAPSPGDIPNLSDAIFAARQGVVSSPTRLNREWTVFIVRKITPAKLEPLARVRRQVVRHLVDSRRRQVATRFESGYKARWRARTNCGHGYVVQKCAQYTGAQTAEESPFPSE
jgi:hypothetical protein